jgi:hypothetical protein
MPSITSDPAAFAITVPVGGGAAAHSCSFVIPAGIWSSGTWEVAGVCTADIESVAALGNSGGVDMMDGATSGAFNLTAPVSAANMAAINSAADAGKLWSVNLQLGIETPTPDIVNVIHFALDLVGSASSLSGSEPNAAAGGPPPPITSPSPLSSRSQGSFSGIGQSSSSGGGCIQVGTTGSTAIAYDSVDPIYADSVGYWVVFDDTVQVIADIDTPGVWAMAFDNDANPADAFVTVDPMAASGNYFINYYIPVPSSSSSSSPSPSSSSSSLPSASSSSSGSSGSASPVALFVSSFCVSGGSSSSASMASGSSGSGSASGSASASASASSEGGGGGGSSSSSSSGGLGSCNAYQNLWFNAGDADKTFQYTINQVTFHGTNDQLTDLNNNYSITGIYGGYKLNLTPQQPLGVCIPSAGMVGLDDPSTSWTNFQAVLASELPTWQFNYVGLTQPLPADSLNGRTYEVLLGKSVGFLKGKIARFGVRLHLEYCPLFNLSPLVPTTNLHWIQVFWGNCTSSIEVGKIFNMIDTGNPFFGEPFVQGGAIGLTLASSCESEAAPAIGVFISDNPKSDEQPNFPYPAYTLRLETFLVQDMGIVSGKRTINVYDGIQWGWNVSK